MPCGYESRVSSLAEKRWPPDFAFFSFDHAAFFLEKCIKELTFSKIVSDAMEELDDQLRKREKHFKETACRPENLCDLCKERCELDRRLIDALVRGNEK